MGIFKPTNTTKLVMKNWNRKLGFLNLHTLVTKLFCLLRKKTYWDNAAEKSKGIFFTIIISSPALEDPKLSTEQRIWILRGGQVENNWLREVVEAALSVDGWPQGILQIRCTLMTVHGMESTYRFFSSGIGCVDWSCSLSVLYCTVEHNCPV